MAAHPLAADPLGESAGRAGAARGIVAAMVLDQLGPARRGASTIPNLTSTILANASQATPRENCIGRNGSCTTRTHLGQDLSG